MAGVMVYRGCQMDGVEVMRDRYRAPQRRFSSVSSFATFFSDSAIHCIKFSPSFDNA